MIVKIVTYSLILFALLFIYASIEPFLVRLKKYKIKVNKNALKGLSVIFLSDFHLSKFVSKKYLNNVVKKANELNPDLIILGGDYVSYREKYIGPIFDILAGLKAKIGVYGVLGNHDLDVNKEFVLENMRRVNIKSLNNESYWLNIGQDRMRLGGVADILRDQPDIIPTIEGVKEDDFVIVVSHNPDFIEDIKDSRINLMLSGHTHGGQITFFGFAPHIPSKYRQKYKTGLKCINNIQMIVSNGIGCVGIPLRFFAPPQIVLIELI